MFNVNDIVVCGNNGICRIETIEMKRIMNQPKQFYIMRPIVASSGTLKTQIMLATDTLKPMRYLKTKDELYDILNAMAVSDYYEEKDYKKREKYYREIINSQDIFYYIDVLKTIYSSNMFSSSTDRMYIDVIKRICNEEVSFVLNLNNNDEQHTS